MPVLRIYSPHKKDISGALLGVPSWCVLYACVTCAMLGTFHVVPGSVVDNTGCSLE